MNKPITNTHFITLAGPLLLIIFIDSMGLGLLFPILNALIMDPNGGFFAQPLTADMRNIIYGMTVAIYMLCWFFGAAILGDLSDQIGRRKSLLICLFGAFAGYLLSAIAVSVHSLTLLILGRMIAGLTAGSQAIAQAAIIDISAPANKARNIGFVLLCMALGFIFGPLIGGVLSDPKLIPGVAFSTPLYFAAIISLINAGLLWVIFKETFNHASKLKIAPQRAITIFISAFTNEKVKPLSIIFFIMIFGWSSFYSFIPLFLLRVYHFSPLMNSLYMAVMGIGFGIGNGILTDYCAKRYALKKIAVNALLISALMTFFIIIASRPLIIWLAIVPLGCTVSLAYAAVLTIFSNQVDADSQGWIMGISGAIMAFVFGLDGLVVALLANFSARLPIIIAMLGLGSAAIAMQFGHKNNDAIINHSASSTHIT